MDPIRAARDWWLKFLRDSGATGFWHETYYRRGGMEAIYADMDKPVGPRAFAPELPARGAAFSARQRLGLEGDGPAPPAGAADAEAAWKSQRTSESSQRPSWSSGLAERVGGRAGR